MANRIERILESIKANAESGVYESVTKACSESDIKAIIAELENTCGGEVVAKVMKPCGYQCIPKSWITLAKSIHLNAESIEDFLSRLNKKRIGGGKLHIKGDKIIGIYEQCYCSLATKTKGLSPLYCHCSEGWYEKLFSSVLEKPVVAKKLRTILDGSNRCEFEISY